MIIEVSLPHFTEGKLKDKALNEQVRDEAGTRIRKETGSCYFPSSQVSAYFSNMVSYYVTPLPTVTQGKKPKPTKDAIFYFS